MEQLNEVLVEKIAKIEAQIQQKNEEKIEIRERMTQFQAQKRQFEAKFLSEKQQLAAKFESQKQELEVMHNGLKSENNSWEMDMGKLLTELKTIKLQTRANHCVRHPRMLAGLRVDCGEEGHMLCIGCIRNGSTSLTSRHCPFCRKHIKGGGIEASELEQLVVKLLADERMLRPDAFLPLPFELNVEMWQFAKKNQRFVLYGKNRLENEAGSSADNLKFLSDDGLSVYKENRIDNSFRIWSTVRAIKPFCVLKAALVDHFLPDIFYFEVLVKRGYIYIGLSGLNFPLSNDINVGREAGSYSLNTWAVYEANNSKQNFKLEKGWYAIGGNIINCSRKGGDVAGCGLLLSPNDHSQHRIFFTKNGQLFCKPMLLPAMVDDNSQLQLFPTVTLLSDTSIVANFGDDPEKPFYYKFRKQNLSKKGAQTAEETAETTIEKKADTLNIDTWIILAFPFVVLLFIFFSLIYTAM